MCNILKNETRTVQLYEAFKYYIIKKGESMVIKSMLVWYTILKDLGQ